MHPHRSTLSPARALLLVAAAALLTSAAGALESGDPAPAFDAPRLSDGSTLSLASLRGKVVYLDFWASWCAPCATSLPVLDALGDEFGKDGFAVLAVNVDREPERAAEFLAKRPVSYPSVSDPQGELPERFGIETMPTSFLIDRAGVIRYVHRGFRKGDEEILRAQIRKLMAGR